LNLPRPVAAALLGLCLRDTEAVARFLEPRLSDLTDPFLLPDMDVAVRRIWKALDDGEAIAVFGDYDADGITSTALLIRLLDRLGGTATPWLPAGSRKAMASVWKPCGVAWPPSIRNC